MILQNVIKHAVIYSNSDYREDKTVFYLINVVFIPEGAKNLPQTGFGITSIVPAAAREMSPRSSPGDTGRVDQIRLRERRKSSLP